MLREGDAGPLRRAARSAATARHDAQPVASAVGRRAGVPHGPERGGVRRHLPPVVPLRVQRGVQRRRGGEFRPRGLAPVRRRRRGEVQVLPQTVRPVPRRAHMHRRGGGGGEREAQPGPREVAAAGPEEAQGRGARGEGEARAGGRGQEPVVRAKEARRQGQGAETRTRRRRERTESLSRGGREREPARGVGSREGEGEGGQQQDGRRKRRKRPRVEAWQGGERGERGERGGGGVFAREGRGGGERGERRLGRIRRAETLVARRFGCSGLFFLRGLLGVPPRAQRERCVRPRVHDLPAHFARLGRRVRVQSRPPGVPAPLRRAVRLPQREAGHVLPQIRRAAREDVPRGGAPRRV